MVRPELGNGRLAVMAFVGAVFQDGVAGSVLGDIMHVRCVALRRPRSAAEMGDDVDDDDGDGDCDGDCDNVEYDDAMLMWLNMLMMQLICETLAESWAESELTHTSNTGSRGNRGSSTLNDQVS